MHTAGENSIMRPCLCSLHIHVLIGTHTNIFRESIHVNKISLLFQAIFSQIFSILKKKKSQKDANLSEQPVKNQNQSSKTANFDVFKCFAELR